MPLTGEVQRSNCRNALLLIEVALLKSFLILFIEVLNGLMVSVTATVKILATLRLAAKFFPYYYFLRLTVKIFNFFT